MGKSVPDLGGRPVRATDHNGVATRVIETLQPLLSTIPLKYTHTRSSELVAQNINRLP